MLYLILIFSYTKQETKVNEARDEKCLNVDRNTKLAICCLDVYVTDVFVFK